MKIKESLIYAGNRIQASTGIYPTWKRECFEITRQKVQELTPKISELAEMHLSVPSVCPTLYPCSACYFSDRQTIGINSTSKNLQAIFPIRIDAIVVHELSHHLWENTPGRVWGTGEVGKMWIEGFAEFLQTNYFRGLVPEEGIYPNKDKVYEEGRSRAIYIAIYKKTPRAVFEIPQKWKEYEEDYQKHLRRSNSLDWDYLD